MEEIIAEVSVDPDKNVEVDQAGAEQTEEVRTAEDHSSTEEARTTEEPALAEAQPDNAAKGSKDFSPEERATIIAMAKELGTAKVSREFGIRYGLISYWLHQERKRAAKSEKPSKLSKALKPSKTSEPEKQTAANVQTKDNAQTKGKDSKRTLGRVKEAALISEGAPTVVAVPTEPVKTVEPIRPVGRKTVSAKPQGSAEPPKRSENEQVLIIENAILKERVAAQNAEIEKLRAALTSLM